MAPKRVLIAGAGDLGRSQRAIFASQGVEVAGFVDDRIEAGTEIDGAPVLGPLEQLPRLCADRDLAASFAIGYDRFELRARRFEELAAAGAPFVNCVHASAVIDGSAELGRGVVLFAGAVVDHGCALADNTLINAGAVVAHDSRIRAHAFVAPGAAIAGFVDVGRCAMVGLGARVIERVTIGDGAVVAAGAVVLADVEPFALVAGVPAKTVRINPRFDCGTAP